MGMEKALSVENYNFSFVNRPRSVKKNVSKKKYV